MATAARSTCLKYMCIDVIAFSISPPLSSSSQWIEADRGRHQQPNLMVFPAIVRSGAKMGCPACSGGRGGWSGDLGRNGKYFLLHLHKPLDQQWASSDLHQLFSRRVQGDKRAMPAGTGGNSIWYKLAMQVSPPPASYTHTNLPPILFHPACRLTSKGPLQHLWWWYKCTWLHSLQDSCLWQPENVFLLRNASSGGKSQQ